MKPDDTPFVPEFSKKTLVQKPLLKDGQPKTFLGFLVPLLSKTSVTKSEMLRCAGLETTKSNERGYFSDYFGALRKTGILEYNINYQVWTRGPNFWVYIGFVMQEFCKHEAKNTRITNLFRNYTSTSTVTVMELAEEQDCILDS